MLINQVKKFPKMKVEIAKIFNPYPAGDTNVYIINGEVVFDSGINLPQSVEALEKALKNSGIDFDSAKLVISHPHADHFGSAYLFSNVLAHENSCWKLSDAEESYFKLVYQHFMNEGMPLKLAEQMEKRVKETYKGLVLPCGKCGKIGSRVKAGDDVLEVIHIPGHSYGHIALYHRGSCSLFSGDVMLDGITPNPVIEPVDEVERLVVIELYLNTLKKLYSLDVKRVYPGHRKMKRSHREVIREYLDSFQQRSFEVFEHADGKNSFEIATSLFGKTRQVFLIMTETIAQVDFLVEKGILERRDGKYIRTAEIEDLRELWTEIKERTLREG